MPKRAPILFEKFDRNYVALSAAMSDPLVSCWLSNKWAKCHDGGVLSLVFEQDKLLYDLAAEAGARLNDLNYFLSCSECFKVPDRLPQQFAVVTPIQVQVFYPMMTTVVVRFPLEKCQMVVAALKEQSPMWWGSYSPSERHATRELYLFGQDLWVLERPDFGLSKSDLALRFITSQLKLNRQKERLLGQVAGTKPQRKTIPVRVRNLVWERDGSCCVECGSKVDLQFDHVIPIDQGGASTPENLQILCLICNNRKGNNL